MSLLLAFAIVLVLSMLLTEQARHSVLSIPVLFILAGIIAGPSVLGLAEIRPDDERIHRFVEVALFAVLFVDGMHIGLQELKSVWTLPGRALLFGMPLTLLGMALLAHFVAGLSWIEAFLIAAVLSPTDPVFASDIIGRKEVPERVRRLLNVESGVNDGIALPIVLTMLALAGGSELDIVAWLGQVALGIGIGVAVPLLLLIIERLEFLRTVEIYTTLFVFGIGLLLYSLSQVIHANLFLAAFVGGMTIATAHHEMRDEFSRLGAAGAEGLKLAAVLVFGAFLSFPFFQKIGARDLIFALLALFVARPLAIVIALLQTKLSAPERLVAAWFGPRGFASVVYGLLVFGSGIANAVSLFRLVAVVIVASIIAHSSTDAVIASWMEKRIDKGQEVVIDEIDHPPRAAG